MSFPMSPHEIEDFLSESNIARIATVKPDGSPHVTPVWYLWENNQLLILIMKGSVKESNIKQKKKVAVTVDSNTAPNKGVIIEGTAKIEELTEEIERRICQRYLKKENLDEYLELSHGYYPQILIRIQPEKIITWDYSKIPILNRLLRV
jgi:PPOX class probable F420-dependent enzyme